MSEQPRVAAVHEAAFFRLPQEIHDMILSELDSHKDLLNFALVSRRCARLAVPRHTDYRIIRVRYLLPPMWAHLARRADLARNIREVRVCDTKDYSASDHQPLHLLEKHDYDDVEAKKLVLNMCAALEHMERIEVFTWHSRAALDPKVEECILSAVMVHRSLQRLALEGKIGMHVHNGRLDGRLYPPFETSNLRYISLLGDSWFRKTNSGYTIRLLQQCPAIEFLELPMELSGLAECQFPRLKTLKLHLFSGTSSPPEMSRTAFLENHPTIEELSWYPIGPVQFSSECLPALRRLETGRQVLEALEETKVVRSIECLDVMSFGAEDLLNLKNVDRTALRKIEIHTFRSMESICKVADLFPNITYLRVPGVRLDPGSVHPTHPPLSDWINMLSRFRNLEIFRGNGLWASCRAYINYHSVMAQMHVAIMELVQLCPRLRQLDHCQIHPKRGDVNRIRIIREGVEGENVRYEVIKPPSRYNSPLFCKVLDAASHGWK